MSDEENVSIELLTMNKLISKKYPLVKSLIAMKTLMTTNYFYYLSILCVKFIAISILSNNKWVRALHNADGTEKLIGENNMSLSDYIKYITFFGIFANSMSYKTYAILSYIIFFVQIVYTVTYIKYLIYCKQNSDMRNINSSYLKIFTTIFHLNLISSQHLIEFCTFIFPIYFKSAYSPEFIPNTNVKLTKFFLFESPVETSQLALVVINAFMIFFYNIHIFYTFKLINEPFFIAEMPVVMRSSNDMQLLFMITSNLLAIHYFEFLFIPGTIPYYCVKWGIFTFILFLLLSLLVRRFKAFNFNNLFNNLAFFLFTFTLCSYFVEIILFLLRCEITNGYYFLFVIICKAILSICFTYSYYYLKNYYFIKRCSDTLFRSYDGRYFTNEEIECFYYFTNLFIKFKSNSNYKNNVAESSIIVNIIKTHKQDCNLNNCKCNIIKNLSDYNKVTLTTQLNELIESIFSLPSFVKNRSGNYMFTQYLLIVRSSNLFSYSVINYLVSNNQVGNSKVQKYSDLELFEMFVLLMIVVKTYRIQLVHTDDFVDFKYLYSKYKLIKNYGKKILKINQNFGILLNYKEKFIGSLKLDQKSLKFDSFILNSLDYFIHGCKNFKRLYQDFKKLILSEKKKDLINIEIAYTIFSFYSIYNKKVPKKILNMICIDRIENINNFQKYFNSIFNKYFSDNSVQSVIIDIKNTFRIKYFSYRLGLQLGFENSSLIGKDINEILPECLRDAHRTGMLNYFLVKKNSILSLKTHIFTKLKNIYPISLSVSIFIDLNKNMTAMANLKILDKTEYKSHKFILNQNYQVLGVSNNFESQYHLDFEAIDFLKINVPKLFGVDEVIDKFFESKLEKLETFNNRLKINNLNSLANYIYVGENTYTASEDLVMIKTQLLERKEKEKMAAKNIKVNATFVGSPRSANSPLPTFAPLTKSSNRLLNRNNKNYQINDNTDKSKLSNFSQIPYGSDYSLADNIEFKSKNLILIRDKRNIINNLKKLIVKCRETNGLYDEFQQAKLMKSLEAFEQNRVSSVFRIKLKLKKIYGTPFFIFSFKEEEKLRHVKPILGASFFVNLSVNMLSQPILNESTVKYLRKAKNEFGSTKIKNAPLNLNKVVVKDKSKTSKIKFSRPNVKEFKNKVLKKEASRLNTLNKLAIVLALLIAFNVGITVFIFYFKASSILITKSLFLITYYNNMQQSSLVYLHSGILSLSMKLDDFSSFNTEFTQASGYKVTEEDIKRVVSLRIDIYRDNFAKFLEAIRNSTFKIQMLEDMLYNETFYNKTLLTWENVNSKETYLSAQQYITSNSRLLTQETNYDSLKQDIENGFLFERYLEKREELQVSKHSRLLYFMNLNVPFKFYDIFMKFKNLISTITERYNSYWLKVSTIFEVLEICVAFFIFLFIYLILRNFDKSLFSFILSIFLNLETGKKQSYKSNTEMIILKTKLRILKEFLTDFTVENIRKMDATLNDYENKNNTDLAGENFQHSKNPTLNISTNINANASSSFAALNPSSNQNSLFRSGQINTSIKDYMPTGLNSELNYTNVNKADVTKQSIESGKYKPKLSPREKSKDKIKAANEFDIENTYITNSKVFKNTKHYSISIIKYIQVTTLLLFGIYIVFLCFNFLSNKFFFSSIDSNFELINTIINRLPIIALIYNNVRLSVIENNTKYIEYYSDILSEFEINDDVYVKFTNSYNSDLASVMNYTRNVNNVKNSTLNRSEYLCKNDPVCSIVVMNGFNSKGLYLSVRSALLLINNVYKDYIKVVGTDQKKYIPSKDKIFKYFKNEEFENVNLQIEFVLDNANQYFMEYVSKDMSNIFSFVLNLNIVLGLISISFNFVIIIYLYVGYLANLNDHLKFISYSSKKLNKVLFSIAA